MKTRIFLKVFLILSSVNAFAWTTVEKSGVTIAVPKGSNYDDRIDFAELEHSFPLKRDILAQLKPSDLATWDQESLDQLYARLSSGPKPEGLYHGEVLNPKDGGISRMLQIVGAPKFFVETDKLGTFMDTLWHGKNFYKDREFVRNRLTKKTLKLAGFLKKGPVEPPVVDGDEVELIPGKLLCGQSLMDSRRESIVLEYSFNSDLPDYQKNIDGFANALGLREELRMIRPGFYLGRAYVQHLFIINFILETDKASGETKDACWVGTQKRDM